MQVSLIVHDIRSCHNVGSILRTADGFGVDHVYLSGYTPYPEAPHDERLPHVRRKLTAQIHKTALGAETSVAWSHVSDIHDLLSTLRNDGCRIVALEQSIDSIPLPTYTPSDHTVLLLGREVEGLEEGLLRAVDDIIEIPMAGQKESFNVAIATAIALYGLSTKA